MDNKAMYKLSYGLFVLTAKVGDKQNGCITNTAIQVTTDPNQIAFAVNKANYTHDMLMESKVFNISILSEEADFEVFKRFGFQSGRDVDKFADYGMVNADGVNDKYAKAANGIYFIKDGTNAYISGEVTHTTDLGSHTLFICKVTDMEVLSEASSATYEYYQKNIKPKPEAVGTTPEGKTVWRCKICGYEFEGDELPEDFICPWCKHPASDFEKVVK